MRKATKEGFPRIQWANAENMEYGSSSRLCGMRPIKCKNTASGPLLQHGRQQLARLLHCRQDGFAARGFVWPNDGRHVVRDDLSRRCLPQIITMLGRSNSPQLSALRLDSWPCIHHAKYIFAGQVGQHATRNMANGSKSKSQPQ